MRYNVWFGLVGLLLGSAFVFFGHHVAMAQAAVQSGHWAEPYMNEMQRLDCLSREVLTIPDNAMGRSQFMSMLLAHPLWRDRADYGSYGERLQREKLRERFRLLAKTGVESKITRGQAIEELSRLQAVLGDKEKNHISFVEDDENIISQWNRLGLSGYENGAIKPERTISLAEGSVLMYQFLYHEPQDVSWADLEKIDLEDLLMLEDGDEDSFQAKQSIRGTGVKQVYVLRESYPIRLGRIRLHRPPERVVQRSGRIWLEMVMDAPFHDEEPLLLYMMFDEGRCLYKCTQGQEWFLSYSGADRLYMPMNHKASNTPPGRESFSTFCGLLLADSSQPEVWFYIPWN